MTLYVIQGVRREGRSTRRSRAPCRSSYDDRDDRDPHPFPRDRAVAAAHLVRVICIAATQPQLVNGRPRWKTTQTAGSSSRPPAAAAGAAAAQAQKLPPKLSTHALDTYTGKQAARSASISTP
jgi:hypothetical protein